MMSMASMARRSMNSSNRWIYIYNEAHIVNVGIEIYGEIETTSFLVTMVCFADNIVVASIVCGSYVFVGEIRQRKAQEKKIG